MFERFTDRARRVLVLAQEEAHLLTHSYIGTEHVLLGLVAERDGVAAEALGSLGVSLEGVREQVKAIVGQGDTPPIGHIPFTPRAKKVLELSLREALALGHNYIGTEHLLLGLVREGQGVACRVITALGADLGAVRERVVEVLSQTPRGEAEDRPSEAHAAPAPDHGWELLERLSEGGLRALLHARGLAAGEGRAAIEARDLAAGVLRARDPLVIAALEQVGAAAPAVDEAGPATADAPLPVAGSARAACLHALRATEKRAVEPAHLLLGCLSALDARGGERIAEGLGVEAGVLATELTDRLQGGT